MLVTPLDTEGISRFQLTTLEQQMGHDLILDSGSGIQISMLNIDRYLIPEHPPVLDAEDAALLTVGHSIQYMHVHEHGTALAENHSHAAPVTASTYDAPAVLAEEGILCRCQCRGFHVSQYLVDPVHMWISIMCESLALCGRIKIATPGFVWQNHDCKPLAVSNTFIRLCSRPAIRQISQNGKHWQDCISSNSSSVPSRATMQRQMTARAWAQLARG